MSSCLIVLDLTEAGLCDKDEITSGNPSSSEGVRRGTRCMFAKLKSMGEEEDRGSGKLLQSVM